MKRISTLILGVAMLLAGCCNTNEPIKVKTPGGLEGALRLG